MRQLKGWVRAGWNRVRSLWTILFERLRKMPSIRASVCEYGSGDATEGFLDALEPHVRNLQLTTVALRGPTAPSFSSAQVVDMLHFLTRHNLACIIP